MLKPWHWTWLPAAAVLALAFWPTLASFPAVWSGDPYTHGWIVAGLCAWLVWRQRRVLGDARESGEGWPPALAATAALSFVWLLATIANVRVVHQAMLPLLLVCFGAAALGVRAGLLLAPIGATFLLAVPFWEVFSPALQAVTVAVSGVILSIANVPVTIDGTLIHINAGTFEVADACSGLRYLMAGLVIGAFYAHLFLEQWRSRLAVLALAAGISILANWARVSSLIVIGHVSNMEAGIIRNHGPYGWWLFVGSLVPFFLLARGIERREMRRLGGGEYGAGRPFESPGLADLGMPAAGIAVSAEAGGGGAGGDGAALPPGSWRRVVLACAVAVLGPAVYLLFGSLPEVAPTPPALYGQSASGGWQAIDPAPERPSSWQPAFMGADQHRVSVWTDGETPIYVDHLVYREQTQGAELIQYANRIAPASMEVRERFIGPLDRDWRTAWEALVFTPEGPILVWYWFRVGGMDTASTLRAKALEVPAFLLRRRTAELVAVSAKCGPESCAEASETVRRFVLGPPPAAQAPDGAGPGEGADGTGPTMDGAAQDAPEQPDGSAGPPASSGAAAR